MAKRSTPTPTVPEALKGAGKFTGKDLAKLRAEHDLTRPALFDAIGLHRNTCLKWETDDADIPLEWRLALAAYLDGLAPVARQGRAR